MYSQASNSIKIFPPNKYIRDELEQRGWTQADLAYILGRSHKDTNDILVGKRKITPELAQELAAVFQKKAEYWLELENAYKLSQTDYVDKAIVKRSRLFNDYPAKEMLKRGWIEETDDIDELERRFLAFFSEQKVVGFAARKSSSYVQTSPTQVAWIIRATKLAKKLIVEKFEASNLASLEKALRRLAAKSQAVHRVPELLSRYGIRFVVVEPLPNAKIDGAAFWLDENSPVIAMSIRFDNIGSFWFTLMHEISHIKHKDRFFLDDLESLPIDDIEIRANQEAAESLVPQQQLETFIKLYSPFFSEARVNNLATQLKIHPGVIVGQLQHRKEVGYNTHRKAMVKIREIVTTTAFTDGWGNPIPQVR
ncbi:MAG: ImmA/IrrE family metallo-endopeptidase [Acidobacteriota bacterium]|nr:ImmA/IrrE family metallo-endopeptidase [Acidobacteriota bacterium]